MGDCFGFGESGRRTGSLNPEEEEEELSSEDDESAFFLGAGFGAAALGGAALVANGLRVGNLKPESLSEEDELSLSDKYPIVALFRILLRF